MTNTHRHAVFAMATRFEMIVSSEVLSETRLQAACSDATLEIEELDAQLSRFRKDSKLSHINRSASYAPVRIDTETWNLLRIAQDVFQQTSGAFDVTVGSAMDGLGSHSVVGMNHVILDEADCSVAFDHEGIVIDLGGIAKGYAIDRVLEIFQDCGITSALVHGGTSTVGAIGTPVGRRGWGIRIHDPRRDADPSAFANIQFPVVYLKDAVLSVSAPNGRILQDDRDQSHGHVIDPKTGESADSLSFAATIASAGVIADAWSTALVVLGSRSDTIDDRCPVTSILPTNADPNRDEPYTVTGTDKAMIDWVSPTK